jgi:hypothetical protein
MPSGSLALYSQIFIRIKLLILDCTYYMRKKSSNTGKLKRKVPEIKKISLLDLLDFVICMYVYIYIYIYIYIYMYVCMYVYIYTHTHHTHIIYIYAYIYTHMNTHTYMCVYTYTYIPSPDLVLA